MSTGEGYKLTLRQVTDSGANGWVNALPTASAVRCCVRIRSGSRHELIASRSPEAAVSSTSKTSIASLLSGKGR